MGLDKNRARTISIKDSRSRNKFKVDERKSSATLSISTSKLLSNSTTEPDIPCSALSCSIQHNRLLLPFQRKSSFYRLGDSLLHITRCTTNWTRKSTSSDKCDVCKIERQAIIDQIKEKVADRLHRETANAVQDKPVLELTKNDNSGEVAMAVQKVASTGSNGGKSLLRPGQLKVATMSTRTGQAAANNSKTSQSGGQSPNSDNVQPEALKVVNSHGESTQSKSVAMKRTTSILLPTDQKPSSTRMGRTLQPNMMDQKKKVPLSARISTATTAVSSMLSVRSSLESLNGRVLVTYAEWEKIKEQTLSALYDANPDVDKLYSMFRQVRKVRMSSAEMSNTCNEAQALLDNTVGQLYSTMTEPCKENMSLNKLQDTDLAILSALIHAAQALRLQLQQFNVYDRDGIVKRAYAKIKDRLKKCIAVATRTKNKDQLTELILVIKNNTHLRCNDLMETARRQVQGINYDNFVSKHSNRLRQSEGAYRAKSTKGDEFIVEELRRVIHEMFKLDTRLFENELDVQLFVRLIESLEINLKRTEGKTNPISREGLEWYFKIIRGVIRKTTHGESDTDDIIKLRKVLKGHGRSLPLRMKTLEVCQLVETFQTAKLSLNKKAAQGSKSKKEEILLTIQEATKQLTGLFKDPELTKIVPEKIGMTLITQTNQLLEELTV